MRVLAFRKRLIDGYRKKGGVNTMQNFKFVEIETIEMPSHASCAIAGVGTGAVVAIIAVGIGAAIT